MERDRVYAKGWQLIDTNKRPTKSLAQFDATISPIIVLRVTVKQKCCAMLCDSPRDAAKQVLVG